MTRFDTFFRVFSLFALASFLITTYFVASSPRYSTSSIKTAINNHWDLGLSLLSKSESHHESAAGQRSDDLTRLIDQLIDAKLAQIASSEKRIELKKRALPPPPPLPPLPPLPGGATNGNGSADPMGLGVMVSNLASKSTPIKKRWHFLETYRESNFNDLAMSPANAKAAGASISSAISGALSNLASGVEDSLLASLQGASGALGEGKYNRYLFALRLNGLKNYRYRGWSCGRIEITQKGRRGLCPSMQV